MRKSKGKAKDISNEEPIEEHNKESIYILILVEKHLIASTREQIIDILRENELYFDPEVDSHQYYPSEAFIENIPLDDPDYLPPPDNPDLQLEEPSRFENDPPPAPPLTTPILHLSFPQLASSAQA